MGSDESENGQLAASSNTVALDENGSRVLPGEPDYYHWRFLNDAQSAWGAEARSARARALRADIERKAAEVALLAEAGMLSPLAEERLRRALRVALAADSAADEVTWKVMGPSIRRYVAQHPPAPGVTPWLGPEVPDDSGE